MKKCYLSLVLIVIVLSVASACTTMPERFKETPNIEINDDGYRFSGYAIDAEDADGFNLEICYISYSLFAKVEGNIPEAKNYFIKVAHVLAEERGRAIEPIVKSMLTTNNTRNEMDGRNASFIFGRVKYAR